MKFGSLFAGIGGFDLGLERSGMRCEWQVEIDEFCNKVLEKHWRDVPRFGDIRECGKRNLAPVDVICGGFPCQPFSVAGKRRGKEDDRHLWPEMLRVISELKPTWVIGENVSGFINMGLDVAFADLEAEGYEVEAIVLPACGVNAPHQRYRVFIVAHTKCDSAGTTFRQRGNGRGADSQQDNRDGVGDDAGNGGGEIGTHVAHANGTRRPQCETGERGLPEFDANGNGIGGYWHAEPGVCGISDEFSKGMDGFDRIAETHYTMGITNGGIEDAHAEKERPREEVCPLRQANGTQDDKWPPGRSDSIPEAIILRQNLHGGSLHPTGCEQGGLAFESGEIQGPSMRDMRNEQEAEYPPHRQGYIQQRGREPDDIVRFLSSEMALGTWQGTSEKAEYVQDLRRACEEIGYVPKTLSALPQVWRSMSDEEKRWVGLRISTGDSWCADWPRLPRVAIGVANRVDRLKCLGNAVVPQLVEVIGRAIMEVEGGAL